MILFIACLLFGTVMVVEAWQELTCWWGSKTGGILFGVIGVAVYFIGWLSLIQSEVSQ